MRLVPSTRKSLMRLTIVCVMPVFRSMFAVALDLMTDWRNTPGAIELLPFFDCKTYNLFIPSYRSLRLCIATFRNMASLLGLMMPPLIAHGLWTCCAGLSLGRLRTIECHTHHSEFDLYCFAQTVSLKLQGRPRCMCYGKAAISL